MFAIAAKALPTVARPEEAAGSLWQTSYRGVWNGSWGADTVLSKASKRDSNFMLEQANVAPALVYQPQRTRTTGPWRRDLLEDFSTMMRGLEAHVLSKFSCGVI